MKGNRRDAKGGRTASISASGLLVMQIERYGQSNSDNRSMNSSTFSLGDGVPVLLGHLWIASKPKKIGLRFWTVNMLFRHSLSVSSLGSFERADAVWVPPTCREGRLPFK